MPGERLGARVERRNHAPGNQRVRGSVNSSLKLRFWDLNLPRSLVAGTELLDHMTRPPSTIFVTVTCPRIAYSVPSCRRVGTLGGRHSAQPGAQPGSGASTTVNSMPSIPA